MTTETKRKRPKETAPGLGNLAPLRKRPITGWGQGDRAPLALTLRGFDS
jgi:hypothetical protein